MCKFCAKFLCSTLKTSNCGATLYRVVVYDITFCENV